MPNPLHGPHLCLLSRIPEVPSYAPAPGFLGSPVKTWISLVPGPSPGSPQFPAVIPAWGVPCAQSCALSRTPIPDCSPSLGHLVPFLGCLVSPSLRTPFHPYFNFQNSCESPSCTTLCAGLWEDGDPCMESLRCPHSCSWAEPAEPPHLQDAGRQQGLVAGTRDIGMARINPAVTVPLPQG